MSGESQQISKSPTPKSPTPNSIMDELEKKTNENQKLVWTDTTEKLLVRWGDHASCHQWLHDQSHRKFKDKNYKFSIPIIILSTITGTLNVGMQSFVPSEYLSLATIGVGTVNIFVGIITTLQNFFQYAQLSEAHFNSSVGWSKLSRNIVIELSIDRKYRKDADRFISQCRADYDRLLEQSPSIPTDIIALFKTKFKKNTDLILPDILDNLTHVTVYKPDDFFIPNGEIQEIKDAVLQEVPGTISHTLHLTPIPENFVRDSDSRSFTPNPVLGRETNLQQRGLNRGAEELQRKKSDPMFVPNLRDNKIKWEQRAPRRNSEIVKPIVKSSIAKNSDERILDCPTVNIKDLIAKFGANQQKNTPDIKTDAVVNKINEDGNKINEDGNKVDAVVNKVDEDISTNVVPNDKTTKSFDEKLTNEKSEIYSKNLQDILIEVQDERSETTVPGTTESTIITTPTLGPHIFATTETSSTTSTEIPPFLLTAGTVKL